ncbi:MAG: hypothetical protein JNK85_18480 [Verrucomicrobiales bacterium]|nr:hypothetical protein [Verrucomicrobiales bacterium]
METRFLSDQVVRWRLPAYAGPPPTDSPVAKRLLLPQGELAQIHSGQDPIRYLAAIELHEGGIRGNHYHLAKCETIYLITGALTVVAERRETRERVAIEMCAGDRIYISPGIAHALRITASGWAVEYAPDPLDVADIHRYPLV